MHVLVNYTKNTRFHVSSNIHQWKEHLLMTCIAISVNHSVAVKQQCKGTFVAFSYDLQFEDNI